MNIFQTRNVVNSQTKNLNRFVIKFNGIQDVLKRAQNHRLQAVKDRYNGLIDAAGGLDGVQRTLELGLLSCTMPNITVEKQEVPKFNDVTKATTKFTPAEDLTITFVDYVNGSASAIMLIWQALVGDKRSGAMGFKEDYVLERAYIYAYGPDAPGYTEAEVVDKWLEKHRVVNLWPSKINLQNFDYGQGEFRKVECTFVIDNCYPVEYRGYDSETASIKKPAVSINDN